MESLEEFVDYFPFKIGVENVDKVNDTNNFFIFGFQSKLEELNTNYYDLYNQFDLCGEMINVQSNKEMFTGFNTASLNRTFLDGAPIFFESKRKHLMLEHSWGNLID